MYRTAAEAAYTIVVGSGGITDVLYLIDLIVYIAEPLTSKAVLTGIELAVGTGALIESTADIIVEPVVV